MVSIKEKIEEQIEKGLSLKKEIESLINQGIHHDINKYWNEVQDLDQKVSEWKNKTIIELNIFNEKLIALKIENNYQEQGFSSLFEKQRLTNHNLFIKDSISSLITFLDDIEKNIRNKEIVMLTIDELDNFKDLLKKDASKIDDKYVKSAFLEDDVEEAFLKILDEPYKEQDSGAETRDLFTTKIKYKGERLYSALMFKGRGLKTELNLSNAGKNGNQLLKLAKNSSAQLFLIQHVNKINPEVTETLKDHLLSYSQFKKVYICIVEGDDTARVLRSLKLDLDKLMNKKDKSGRKKNNT